MTLSSCLKFGLGCALLALVASGCGKSDSAGDKPAAPGGTVGSGGTLDSDGLMLFDPDQGKFTVRVPGVLEVQPGDTDGKTYKLKTPSLTYKIGYSEVLLPSDAATDRINKFLAAEVSALQFEEGGKIVGEAKSMEIAGAPGTEVEVEMKDKTHRRIQFIVFDGRLYRLEVAGTSDAVVSADAERFLHSLKLSHLPAAVNRGSP